MPKDKTNAPLATYRVQLSASFDFDKAAGITDYLARLGISHLYCSPYLQAREGSSHGYDVVDPQHISRELGGPEGRTRLCLSLRETGLGQVLDIVPNHMGFAGRENALWWDVLENGQASRYASWFDIDWTPPDPRLRGKVSVPILGDRYGCVLQAGGFQLRRNAAAFTIHYYEHVLPASPESVSEVLLRAVGHDGLDALGPPAEALARLPVEHDEAAIASRHRLKTELMRKIERLLGNPSVASAVDAVVAEVNHDPDRMDAVLMQQHYRLTYWRLAAADLNYRRFFNINTLVGIRTEDDRVFRFTHGLVLRWLEDGSVDGLRIDHPDGLRDPHGYFRRLRDASPETWIVAEKILASEEHLPDDWPVDGTTGYDFLNQVGGLFVDPAGKELMTSLYEEFTSEPTDYEEIVREKKRWLLRERFGAEIERLVGLLLNISEGHPRYRDCARRELRETIEEFIACLPVYRTYIRAEAGVISSSDRRYITEALEAARRRRPDLDEPLWQFLRGLLLLELRGEPEADFVMRLQQFTGAAMAKSVEDTAFYCFNRLVSLNEVGGDPAKFGVSVGSFHRYCGQIQKRWPAPMLSTSTHDTKRGEDVRLRISLLSEIPGQWADAVRRWARMNDCHRRDGMPDRNAEYFLYQTLVGAWPIDAARLSAYMTKAGRESKTQTSWRTPQPAYEDALQTFVHRVLTNGEFLSDFQTFLEPLLEPARTSSLAQTLIRCTAPGVPDLYQGAELWDLNLVDPDNRRPVDYGVRRRLLANVENATAEEVLRQSGEGATKLYVIYHALRVRRRYPEGFGSAATYHPLEPAGEQVARVVAFARGDMVVTVVPRLVYGLHGHWGDTLVRLPGGLWRNDFTGEALRGGDVRLADLLGRFPVALLIRERTSSS